MFFLHYLNLQSPGIKTGSFVYFLIRLNSFSFRNILNIIITKIFIFVKADDGNRTRISCLEDRCTNHYTTSTFIPIKWIEHLSLGYKARVLTVVLNRIKMLFVCIPKKHNLEIQGELLRELSQSLSNDTSWTIFMPYLVKAEWGHAMLCNLSNTR